MDILRRGHSHGARESTTSQRDLRRLALGYPIFSASAWMPYAWPSFSLMRSSIPVRDEQASGHDSHPSPPCDHEEVREWQVVLAD